MNSKALVAMSRGAQTPTHHRLLMAGVLLALTLLTPPIEAQSLRGSTGSLDRQNRAARQHDFTYLDTPERVRYFATQGWLTRVRPTKDFALHAVSFPYARPEVDLFVRRLGAQYRAACGEQLVVTSLTRPSTRQPRNASDRSVHPTGMAIDIRYSRDRNCRRWLEEVLIDLERAGVLEATRERNPVHYHIALFPNEYVAYVDILQTQATRQFGEITAYTVRSGDSLWTIARRHGTTVDELQRANRLNNSTIYAGQVIEVPLGR